MLDRVRSSVAGVGQEREFEGVAREFLLNATETLSVFGRTLDGDQQLVMAKRVPRMLHRTKSECSIYNSTMCSLYYPQVKHVNNNGGIMIEITRNRALELHNTTCTELLRI